MQVSNLNQTWILRSFAFFLFGETVHIMAHLLHKPQTLSFLDQKKAVALKELCLVQLQLTVLERGVCSWSFHAASRRACIKRQIRTTSFHVSILHLSSGYDKNTC